MLKLDRDALICDLAETYGIYDMTALSVGTIATLSAGLRDNSRIKLKAAGLKTSFDSLILAAIFDRVGTLMYMLSDGKGKEPERILDGLLGLKKDKQCRGFASVADFERERQRIIQNAREK